MRTLSAMCALAVACLLPSASAAQGCPGFLPHSVPEALEYLRQADDVPEAAPCVQAAFGLITGLPPAQAVPILIKYLDYKRPLNQAERQGIFLHFPAPDVLYPAVDALYKIGPMSQPALVTFLAQNENASALQRDNAVYTLLLIRHGDIVSLVRSLGEQAVAMSDKPAGIRLRSAAKNAIQRWCYAEIRQDCERALSRPPP